MINVGIIGCGFVGGALKDWLEHNNPECKLFISDPYKGYNDDLSNIDIAFLQIHVPTEDNGTQDLTLMKELITNLPDVPVFVRTTILSGYINDTHTYVPGPDGKFGYGGKCFPKDVNAFAKMTEGTPLGTLLEHLHELNVHFRGVEEHI